jgi:hypothetical protein
MSIEFIQDGSSNVIEVDVTGKLTKGDYQLLVPETEAAIRRHGKIRILFIMRDFHGWSAGALWEDIKFDLKHFLQIEQLAIVGDTKWQHGMAAFCRPFTTARIKYFGENEIEQAREWIESSSTVKR